MIPMWLNAMQEDIIVLARAPLKLPKQAMTNTSQNAAPLAPVMPWSLSAMQEMYGQSGPGPFS